MQMIADRQAHQIQRFFGKYRGTVASIEDPDKRGRIQAHVPEVGADVSIHWAEPCVPYAGEGVGQFMIPSVGAGVWIEFEAGDLSRPIWTGCWWGRDQPPKDHSGTAAMPPKKIIRSEQGLIVALDDDGQTISVSDDSGSNILEIDVQQGTITIIGVTKAVVEAPQIELVENSSHPLVFGDQLLQYLNQVVSMYQSHMHPGEMALGVFPVTPMPPVPPLPPPTPALLSMKVKTG